MKIFLFERQTSVDGEARAMVIIAEDEYQMRRLAVGRHVETDAQGSYLTPNYKDEGPGPWKVKSLGQSRCRVIGEAAPGAKARVVVVD
ncbi:MAG: hypothetical protein Q8L24_02195 [bacterium]|nr:hypothetical protein [bacterium]